MAIVLGALLGAGAAFAALPAPPAADAGSFVTLDIASKQIAARKVTVWLPADYEKSGEPHAVLYIHDAQNVFDDRQSYSGVAWRIDRALTALASRGAIRRAIVVAIPNAGKDRWREYYPQAAVDALPSELRAFAGHDFSKPESAGLADKYLAYLVTELKPAIDARFRTARGPESTFLIGSSMGGLISLYALASYPRVFGGAACLSTHWPIVSGGLLADRADDPRLAAIAAAFPAWLKNLPAAGKHRLYFDHGSLGLDAHYAPLQRGVDKMLMRKGYRFNADWVTLAFPGADHNERAWATRLEVPLLFLLGWR